MAPKRAAGKAAMKGAKRSKADPVVAQCAEISGMVRNAMPTFPNDVLKMLSSVVQDCLGKPKSERHAFQQGIVDMIGQAVRAVERQRSENVAALEAKAGGAEGEQAARDALVESAVEDVKRLTAAAEAARAAAQAAAAETAAAAKELAAAEDGQKAQELSQKQVLDNQAKLDAFSKGDYVTLKDGAAKAPAKMVKAFAKLAGDFELDPQLLEAAEATLAKPAADRGTFDALIVKELDAFLGARAGDLAQKIAAAEPEREACRTRVEKAVAARDEAQAAEGARRVEAEAAQKALKEAEAARKEAVRAAKEFGPEAKRTAAALATAREDLKDAEGASATFAALAEREVVEEQPAVESAAPPPAEAGAASA